MDLSALNSQPTGQLCCQIPIPVPKKCSQNQKAGKNHKPSICFYLLPSKFVLLPLKPVTRKLFRGLWLLENNVARFCMEGMMLIMLLLLVRQRASTRVLIAPYTKPRGHDTGQKDVAPHVVARYVRALRVSRPGVR